MTLQPEFSTKIKKIGLDIGVFEVKAVLVEGEMVQKTRRPTAGNPAAAAKECLEELLAAAGEGALSLGVTGNHARLAAREAGIKPTLEVEALQAGLAFCSIGAQAVLSLGHENMYYLELDSEGAVSFFNRNGQCAAGSGAFWYQQATRMGFNDRELAKMALEAASPVKISGRCAVFAKSDMTHAINEGASQAAVAAGLAKALVDLVVTGVAQNRINGPGALILVGGVANNKAILKYLQAYCLERQVELVVPDGHDYFNAIGAAQSGSELPLAAIDFGRLVSGSYVPENPLPPLEANRVNYLLDDSGGTAYDLSTVYLGVDCGSVSTKCALLDGEGRFIGGVYLPTAGRPALQVLELIKMVEQQYGRLIGKAPIVACTTGSGRFLAQKILNAEYAVDEITCQAEGVKSLFGDETLSIIEIGGEDSKFVQIKDGLLFDYNMNPVCAAGTGTFLENLAELLGVKIEEEFSSRSFQATYAIDLGDTCTLLSQSTLVAASSRGLPLQEQLASLAYSAARNYLTRTVENRLLEGRLIFTGATAKNHALASAFAAECGKEVFVPPRPELTGALGAALAARSFRLNGELPANSFRSLGHLNEYSLKKRPCKAECRHEHNCQLDVIKFADGASFIYGDRCGRFSEIQKQQRKGGHEATDYIRFRESKFIEAAGESLTRGRSVGLACGGLFHELYPFWAAFFRSLGARVLLSGASSEEILEQGKADLDAEMCYPLEILIGHYRELVKKEPDFIFIPEVINLEPLPWTAKWPHSSSCPLLQMIRGVVVNSLSLPEEQVLYAQLNFRDGRKRVGEQLATVARRLLGEEFSKARLEQALDDGYRALESFRLAIEKEGCRIIEELAGRPEAVVALFLGRSYTLYDEFVSKGSLSHAGHRGLVALPQDFFLEYLRGWYEGRISSPFLDSRRREFESFMEQMADQLENVYPAQLQGMLSAALAAQYFNSRAEESGLPQLHLVLQDPFKCGPNSMLRHYLGSVSGYLRLTLDEHTAAAGMITRLEAFRNTCRTRKRSVAISFFPAKTSSALDNGWRKILIPDGSRHAGVIAAALEGYGVEAAPMPRSKDQDLTLARRYVNGEECLPFIQNMQDYLEYAGSDSYEPGGNGVVFFQGWACGPCRYGMYAPLQSMIIDRAGYGARRICSVKLSDVIKRFGLGFALATFDGTVAVDLLYKMLHSARPYEKTEGAAEALFDDCCEKLFEILRNYRFKWQGLPGGGYLRPFEKLLSDSAERFASIVDNRRERKPRIIVGGEFYVRIDDRCNREIIKQIEQAGGEVTFAPVSEVFMYKVYSDYREAQRQFSINKNLPLYFTRLGYGLINRLAHRDELRLEHAASGMLHGQEEPGAEEIMNRSLKYVSEHYAGEPPMIIGRTAVVSEQERVAGAIFVAPFTCMPASVVEAQQAVLQEELGIPIITIYYDGRDNANREEFIQSLVFQARQKLEQRS